MRLLGHQFLTVAATAVGFTLATNTEVAVVRVGTEGAIRWRADGTDPTASVGVPAYPLEEFSIDEMTELKAFRAIRESSTSVTLHISYYRKEPIP